jgi:septal ring factor EnvC (AmiA/AmiB activator)
LPWPVTKGFISDRFGRKPHPVLKGIYVENQGVDIQTTAGEGVRTVYAGIVQDVASMPGMNNVVAIQHGDYFTIYAKLRSVSVRVGQHVKAREAIGTVATDKNGVSEIQFQIWKEFTKLNPESWLTPR